MYSRLPCRGSIPEKRQIFTFWAKPSSLARTRHHVSAEFGPLEGVTPATRGTPCVGRDSIFQPEMFNRLPQTDVRAELCSSSGSSEICV